MADLYTLKKEYENFYLQHKANCKPEMVND